MARKYTSDELIASVQKRAAVPDVESTGTAKADLLRLLNEEMLSKIVPALMRVREEYLVVTERIALVAGQSAYRIPARAVGQKVRNIDHVMASGVRRKLAFLTRKEADYYDDDTTRETPGGFFFEGNYIVCRPNIGTTVDGSLEVAYYFRPGELVFETNARAISAVNAATKTITVASIPTGWAAGTKLDIHSPHSGAEIKSWDLTIASTTATTITVSEAIDGTPAGRKAVAAGDYVVLAEQAVVPAVPRELHMALVQAAVCRVLESQGDTESLRNHTSELQRQLKDAIELLEPRVEGRPQKIRGQFNPLYGGGRPWRRGGL